MEEAITTVYNNNPNFQKGGTECLEREHAQSRHDGTYMSPKEERANMNDQCETKDCSDQESENIYESIDDYLE